jgi:hypothetical protein
MTTKARKLERKTRAAELDMEIMRAREANGLPVISPMLGLPPENGNVSSGITWWRWATPELLIPSGWRLVSGRSSVAPGGS